MSEAAGPVREPGCLSTLLWGLAFLFLADAGVLAVHAAMMPYGGGGSLFLGWLLTVIAVILCCGLVSKGIGGGGGGLFLAIILAAVISLVFGIAGGRIFKIGGPSETPLIAVEQADQPPNAACDVFHFSNGKILTRYHGLHMTGGRRRTLYYHVAPLVPEGWKETDPVTVWVASEEDGAAAPRSWKQDLRGGYKALSVAEFKELIDKTASRDRLVSRANAPVLLWDDHPRESLMAAAKLELWVMLGLDAAVLLSFLLPFVLARKRPA